MALVAGSDGRNPGLEESSGSEEVVVVRNAATSAPALGRRHRWGLEEEASEVQSLLVWSGELHRV